ncbi:MAG: hypothetical protein KC561_04475 [Myxococcales bacterium]|nr:hypothetical protein [Myxococcales bacterium]
MLKSVMRRFGVSKTPETRTPTYFETLLADALPELAGRESVSLEDVATEVARVEAGVHGADAVNLDDSTIREALVAYLKILAQNDSLPPSGQLEGFELADTRRLLLATALRQDTVNQISERVLAMLEEKFNGGQFTKAALLLRLFETTPARQRNNERTLFYEEMFSRFGVLRLNSISNGQCKQYRGGLKGGEDAGTKLLGAAEWLSEQAEAGFNLLLPTAIPNAAKLDFQDDVLPIIAPLKWRNIRESRGTSLASALASHTDASHLASYCSHLLKTCYFIVLVTGKTGFEPFIKDFFRWAGAQFDCVPTRLLPALHKRTTVGEQGLDSTVDYIRNEYFSPKLDALSETLSIDAAIASFAEALLELDPNELPPGEYNLGGLLLDQAGELRSTQLVTRFRVHRIC